MNKKTKLYKQVKAIENSTKNYSSQINYEIHEKAIFKCKCLSNSLNFHKLTKLEDQNQDTMQLMHADWP
ncbi:1557_t:CDS:2 [Gigaspora margarita]|uniref:1557_t:CDS:1 n=1 Tax=Gigaspora margarita TaxID=4874 RepID=A0ABM8VWB7_GIGMA|nr:1557_t:CDS:2 [Gigaspora margarita]